jgi:5-formyltetrahydrofolate cyclo-ligase
MADHPADPAAFRAALRREKIAARLALPADAHRAASERILVALSDMFAKRPVGTFGFCAPVRAEVDCTPLAETLVASGWRAAMPVAEASAAPMRFRAWTPDASMTRDPYGIPIPETAPCDPPGILLLPLVAFDAAGYRLGYGGGYFDRTLAACSPRPFAVGVGFDCCAVESIFPGPHDIPLDIAVTESGARRWRGA